jgi:glycosyltransferase involved in cell wall biosynthesis
MAKVKVLISTQNPSIGGGVESMRKFLGTYLSQQGFNVTYIFPSRGISDIFKKKKFQTMEVDGIKALQVRSIPYIHLIEHFFSAFSIRRILNQYNIYQALGGANFPSLPFVLRNKPYVCWVATTIEDEDRLMLNTLNPFESYKRTVLYGLYYILKPLFYWFEDRIYKNADKIVALSKHTASLIQKQFQIPAQKISVIPFPIDTTKFRPNDNSNRSIEDNFILMVGRTTDPRKNIKLLLRSFSVIKRQFSKLQLIIVGGNKMDGQLEKLCVKLGIEDSVHLLGQLPNEEIIKYYTHAKLSVLPSLQEGLGIVVLESMACGTPVVSTKCGGPEEVIINGENGYLVENNNVEALADGICKILADDRLRRRMGKKARKHICQNYSLKQVGPKFLEVYREVYPHLFDTDG